MSFDSLVLLAIIAFAIASFAREWLPIDLTAFTTLGLLLLFGLVTPTEAVAGFANPAVVTVMMMFILSHALVKSGLVRRLGYRIAEMAGRSGGRATSGLLAGAGVISAFINNVAAVSILMPVSIHLARHYKVSPSKILLPLSYASIFGGAMTLIGTSTNLLVSALAEDQGFRPFGVFEFASLGAVLFVVGMVYTLVVVVPRLPDRAGDSSLTSKYRLSAFLTETRVPEDSKLVGTTVLDEQISERFEINILEILRGKQRIASDIRVTPIEAGDQLIVRGTMEEILSFKERYGLLLLSDIKMSDQDLADENNILAEVQVAPNSSIADQSLKEIDFRARFGCFVLALNRTGEVIREKLASIPIRQWDTLLIFGPRRRVEALYSQRDFLPLQELGMRLRLSKRWWISTLTIAAVVALAATGVMSILKASILGAVVVLVTGRLTIQEAYEAINWTVIFLVVGVLPLGVAMERTGLAGLIAGGLADAGERWGPLAVLALVYFATAVLTEVISNNSTVVLMVPIALAVAGSLETAPEPFLFGVAFAASSSFLTPMGYKTNAMVFSPGGYRFLDYIRVGTPLKIIFWVISVWLIPVLWPF